MAEIGLQNPISVFPVESRDQALSHEGYRYELVAGENRLQSAMDLGWTEIPAILMTVPEEQKQIWQIDENLERQELSKAERDQHFARRKVLYLKAYPETAQHVAGGKGKAATAKSAVAKQTPSFVADTSAKTGLSGRTIRQAIHRAEAIAPEVRDQIRDMPEIAGSGVELDALGKVPKEKQGEVVRAVKTGKTRSIREAVGSRGKKTCGTRADVWFSTMTGTWARGKVEDHERFHNWIHKQEKK